MSQVIAVVPARNIVPGHARRIVGSVFIAAIVVAGLLDVARALAASKHSRGYSPLRAAHWSEAASRGAGSGSKTATE